MIDISAFEFITRKTAFNVYCLLKTLQLTGIIKKFQHIEALFYDRKIVDYLAATPVYVLTLEVSTPR